MTRSLATHVAALLAGLVLGVGAIAGAQPGGGVRASASSDARIVRELRTLNRTAAAISASAATIGRVDYKLGVLNRSVSGGDTTATIEPISRTLQNIERSLRGYR